MRGEAPILHSVCTAYTLDQRSDAVCACSTLLSGDVQVEISLVSAKECGHPENNNKEPSFREQSRRNTALHP